MRYYSCPSNGKWERLVTAHREFLAVIWDVTLLALYLEGAHFTIPIISEAMRWILTLVETARKLARQRLRLLQFESHIVHRASIKHHAADVLSHLVTIGTDRILLVDEDLAVIIFPNFLSCAPRW